MIFTEIGWGRGTILCYVLFCQVFSSALYRRYLPTFAPYVELSELFISPAPFF